MRETTNVEPRPALRASPNVHTRRTLRWLSACLLVGVSACTRASADAPPPAASDNTQSTTTAERSESPVIDHTVTTIDGQSVSLADYRGTALLIVNTASECGFTRQLGGLQTLHERYQDRGFTVLAFPCNDFGGQEPGSNDEIAAFCSESYGVTFPLFDKVHARGDEQHPLYRTLTSETPEGIAGEIQWNFTKFLVDPDGHVVARFAPATEPLADELIAALEAILPR